MSAITLNGITKRYPDGYLAVDNVDLTIDDGEFVILVGPSGCGKSTLLRMIVGLEDISDGELRIGDEVVNGKAPKDRDLAMVFQNYALYPHLTVRENIAFPLKLAKMATKDINKLVEDVAATLELTDQLDRKPANLSGGQRQRVAMGRAVVRSPKAFLFDEPLSNLDAKLRVQMRTEIARIQRKYGTTTVYVTHDQTEAMTLGDRVAVLRKGVIQQVASPRELYNNPVNLFVAGFIGSPSMNLLPGQLTGSTLSLPFVDIELPAVVSDRMTLQNGERRVIVGLRPEHFEDAELVSSEDRAHGPVFDSEVDNVEWLGSELYAYLPYRGGHDISGTLNQLAGDLDLETGLGEESTITVRFESASRVREGQRSKVWLDARRLQLFDPETGLSLLTGTVREHPAASTPAAGTSVTLPDATPAKTTAADAGTS